MEIYVGLVGVLLGSGLTGAITIYLEHLRGRREREARREQRLHDRQERRYQDRLNAYAALEAVVVKHVRDFDKFQFDHEGLTPHEVGFDEVETAALTDALVHVQLLGSERVEAAATGLAAAAQGYIYGHLDRSKLMQAWDPFRAAARADLVGEPS